MFDILPSAREIEVETAGSRNFVDSIVAVSLN